MAVSVTGCGLCPSIASPQGCVPNALMHPSTHVTQNLWLPTQGVKVATCCAPLRFTRGARSCGGGHEELLVSRWGFPSEPQHSLWSTLPILGSNPALSRDLCIPVSSLSYHLGSGARVFSPTALGILTSLLVSLQLICNLCWKQAFGPHLLPFIPLPLLRCSWIKRSRVFKRVQHAECMLTSGLICKSGLYLGAYKGISWVSQLQVLNPWKSGL